MVLFGLVVVIYAPLALGIFGLVNDQIGAFQGHSRISCQILICYFQWHFVDFFD